MSEAASAIVVPPLKKTNNRRIDNNIITSPMNMSASVSAITNGLNKYNSNESSIKKKIRPNENIIPIIGLFQKLCTYNTKGCLEKVKTRSRIISIIVMCLSITTTTSTSTLQYFINFILFYLCKSKISRHRLVSTELIRSLLVEIYHKKDKKDIMTSSTDSSSRNGINQIVVNEDYDNEDKKVLMGYYVWNF